MDLDAARALLGVSPSSAAVVPKSMMTGSSSGAPVPHISAGEDAVLVSEESGSSSSHQQEDSEEASAVPRRPRSNSAGLDALAFLAEKEKATMSTEPSVSVEAKPSISAASLQRFVPLSNNAPGSTAVSSSSSSSGEDDFEDIINHDMESMPPPPPRSIGRRRSVSNPEGMEKWQPREGASASRFHLVLPAAILEEELAEASAAMKARQDGDDGDDTNITILPPPAAKSRNRRSGQSSASKQPNNTPEENEEVDESKLEPAELLRRARSRLLEDLSEVNNLNNDGELTLPHCLPKYRDVSVLSYVKWSSLRVSFSLMIEKRQLTLTSSFSLQLYNANGRIGIYTPAERAAIIARYQGKRSRRVWNKKIRYNCRKNLADRRLRVKGRFVKRSTEDASSTSATSPKNAVPSIPEMEATQYDLEPEDSSAQDEEMPDVNDPDAGFCPTDDQPFRRVRRHTIT